jgi:hypothetical protein
MNTTSNTHLQLNYPSWSRPRSHWSATHQPSNPKHTNTHSGNLHGLLPVLHRSDRCLRRSDRWHRSDRWTEPVRPVATTAAQQMFQRASNRGGVLGLSVSGDNFDLVVVDPHDPTIRARLPMQSLNQLPMVTNLAGARSAWSRRSIPVRNRRTNKNLKWAILISLEGGVCNTRRQRYAAVRL